MEKTHKLSALIVVIYLFLKNNNLHYRKKILRPYIIFLLLSIFLSGCSSSKGPGDKYLKHISSTISKEYNIPKGELIAKYNLTHHDTGRQCLFAKNYGDIMGSPIASQKFLDMLKADKKGRAAIEPNSKNKITAVYNNALVLNTKYNVISRSDLRKLKHLLSITDKSDDSDSPFNLLDPKQASMSANNFGNLEKFDNIVKNIPIFLPQTKTTITSPFGDRKHPIDGKAKFHHGTDFVGKKHAMIYAAADGKVIEAASSKSYGNFIIVKHSQILKTRYAHLSTAYAGLGERVFQGQLIGLQGKSGRTTADHLHFEVIYNNKPVDPMNFVGSEYRCRVL